MEIPGNLNRCEVLGLVNCTSSALWDQQCIRYANPVQQLCYIWRFFNSNPTAKKKYRHLWPHLADCQWQYPYGSPWIWQYQFFPH